MLDMSGVMTVRPMFSAVADTYWNSTSTAEIPCGTLTWKANTSSGSRIHLSGWPLALTRIPVTFLMSPRGL